MHCLINIQSNNAGWGWLQHIPANKKNTAEVIRAILIQDLTHSDTYINNLYSAIDKFIMKPEKFTRITIEWLWVLKALNCVHQKISLFERDSLTGAAFEEAQAGWEIDAATAAQQVTDIIMNGIKR